MIQPTVEFTAVVGHNGGHVINIPHKFRDFVSDSALKINKFEKIQNLHFSLYSDPLWICFIKVKASSKTSTLAQ